MKSLYHFLKRHKLTSSILKFCDFIRSKKLKEHIFPIYVKTISNHWVSSSYEKEIRACFKKICKQYQLKSFYDIGANVGVFSADFLSFSKQNTVCTFEPNPLMFDCLSKTKKKNALSNLILFQVALSNHCGTVPLYFDPLSPAKGGIHPIRKGKFNHELEYKGITNSIMVEVTTLDALTNLQMPPDIIKIDAEGEELAILQGGKNLLEKYRPFIFFECSKNPHQVKDLLTSYGYQIKDLKFSFINKLQFFNLAIHYAKLIS